MTISQIFARRIREEREQRGWSQAELSRRVTALGHPLDKDAMSKIERGERKVSLDDAVALAAALGVPLPALLFEPLSGEDVDIGTKTFMSTDYFVAWLAGMMPLRREDAEHYWQAPTAWAHGMRTIVNLARLISDRNTELEMLRAYIAYNRHVARWYEEAALRRPDATPEMAAEFQEEARSRYERADEIEGLLPRED
jgi:transcriptional regulator with XRE-family HTH domain